MKTENAGSRPYRSPSLLAFFLHIFTQNAKFLNLQVTIRQILRRKLKILLSLIPTNWTSCTIDVAISSDSRRPGKQSDTLISIKNRTVLTRYESYLSNMKTTVLVLKLAQLKLELE